MYARDKYYGFLAKKDHNKAFQELREEIFIAQLELSSLSKNNLLLPLVKIHPISGLNIYPHIQDHISFRSDFQKTKFENWYYLLGTYIDLLYDEIEKYS